MKNALVVGGEVRLVTEKFAPFLASHGLRMNEHWEWRKQAGAFPDNTEVVVILTDMAGHYLNDTAKNIASTRDLPVIYCVRKAAINKARLEAAGFPETTTMPPISPLAHSPRSRSLRGEARELYDKFVPVLAATPGLSNRALSNRFGAPYGSTGEPARCARDTLGLSDVEGGRAVSIDRNTYEAACRALSITAVAGKRVTKEMDLPTVAPLPVPSTPVTVKPVVVQAATVTFTPAPAPVAPPPAPEPAPKPQDENADFKDLVLLIRTEMAKRNITKLVVTPDNVDATKVITVNESLGF